MQAFVDRADIKQYIGPPTEAARYMYVRNIVQVYAALLVSNPERITLVRTY